jgi:hypothetical protein
MKKRTYSLSTEFIPYIGVGVGIETHSYPKKHRNDYRIILPFFSICLSVVNYKMVRALNINSN